MADIKSYSELFVRQEPTPGLPTPYSLLAVLAFSLLIAPTSADITYIESQEFQLNTRSVTTLAYIESPEFYLDTRTVIHIAYRGADVSLDTRHPSRVWSDSAEFSYDWFELNSPQPGPYVPPVPIPVDSLLRQLDAGGNWVDPFSFPSEGDIVFVINHGWNGSPEGDDRPDNDSRDLAEKIAEKVPGSFIYAWAWGKGPNVVSPANPNGMDTDRDFATLGECAVADDKLECLLKDKTLFNELGKTHGNAINNGLYLAGELARRGIGPDKHRIHMIGKSFGGVVSAEAAKSLYAKSGHRIDQLTTLDTPALPGLNAVAAIDPASAERVEVIYYNWKTKLLLGATGGPIITTHNNTMNLSLSADYYDPPWILHHKVLHWYIESINRLASDCENAPYGFGWSFALDPALDPHNWNLPTGRYGEYPDVVAGKGCIAPTGEVAIQTFGAYTELAREKFDSAVEWAGNKAQIVLDKAAPVVHNLKTGFNSVIELALRALNKSKQLADAGTDDPNEAYIYKSIDIPADAEQLTFDYRFEIAGAGDILTLSIEDEILIILDAQVQGASDEYQRTFPVNIAKYAGQTVLLQIALRPTGDGTSSVLIDNLRFTKRTLPGDITGDLYVGLEDLIFMADQWLWLPEYPSADIAPQTGDNRVNLLDLTLMAEYWNKSIADENSP